MTINIRIWLWFWHHSRGSGGEVGGWRSKYSFCHVIISPLFVKTSSLLLNYPVGSLVTDMMAHSFAHLKKDKKIYCHSRKKQTKLMSWRCCHGSVTYRHRRGSCPSPSSAEQPEHEAVLPVTYSWEAASSVNAVCTDDVSPAEAGDQWSRVRDINTLKGTLLDDHLYWPLPCRRHAGGKLSRAG